MLRVHASGDIASMQNAHASWDGAYMKFPRGPMCPNGAKALLYAKGAIATPRVQMTPPEPTRTKERSHHRPSFIYFGGKPFERRAAQEHTLDASTYDRPTASLRARERGAAVLAVSLDHRFPCTHNMLRSARQNARHTIAPARIISSDLGCVHKSLGAAIASNKPCGSSARGNSLPDDGEFPMPNSNHIDYRAHIGPPYRVGQRPGRIAAMRGAVASVAL